MRRKRKISGGNYPYVTGLVFTKARKARSPSEGADHSGEALK